MGARWRRKEHTEFAEGKLGILHKDGDVLLLEEGANMLKPRWVDKPMQSDVGLHPLAATR